MFDHLRLKNICHLVSVLNSTNLAMRSLIRNRYEYQGTHYDETFAFLKNITGIIDTDARIQLNSTFKDLAETINEKVIASKTILLIQEKKSPYRDQLFNFLLKYRVVDGELIYRPGDVDRSEFSDIRNFLIEASVVEYQPTADRYLIKHDHIHLYVQAQESRMKVTPWMLQRRLAKKTDIGHKAECAIMNYEKNRLGAKYKDHVNHVSVKNEAAGYDIKSVSMMPDNQYKPRYIEVKAVPVDTYHFYWTSNERKVAELLKDYYFLYLLPANHGKIFSLEGLKIIQDPISGILDSPNTWKVETDIVHCSLI